MTSTRPDTDSESGEIIGGGRYRLGPAIGTGGMATVYQAHDLLLDRDVAIKIFRSDVAEASDSRRVEAEMKMLGSINHPSLVTLHDAALSDDGSTPFLVMELVDGEHLASLLRAGPLSTDDAAAVIAQIAGALAHIHAKGIVHRDVKPANILIRRDDDGVLHAKLADLGIARMADATHLTTAGSILGTVAYLSPEQVGGGTVGTAADVYALGLVLFECLTGERPFAGTPAEQAAARTVAQPLVPADVDPDYEVLLQAMTRLDPTSRISAAEVETTLIAGGPPVVHTRAMPAMSDLQATAATPLPGSTDRDSEDDDTAVDVGIADAPSAGDVHEIADDTARLDAAFAEVVATTDSTAVMHGAPVPAPTDQVAVAPDGTATTPAAPGSPTGPTTTAAAPRSRRALHVVLIIVAVLLAAAIAALVIANLMAPETLTPPQYPAVDGELGDLLDELQRSVQP
ncbi:serine/threonine-protein kinase [Herbiconiux sp. L3-i23]|uniref:serine/threonine-protein kinase n=1 Tax=Herbiconiux sp. L3-i23 TaxID=2905871 RepID=UPI00205B2208|nr:serine/threonine-protein kinase [Herbiconiux sp. L3-i23]BDI22046.1 hypothetical protein L3i23_08220 [Herbiconiux sp. L3-i23]